MLSKFYILYDNFCLFHFFLTANWIFNRIFFRYVEIIHTSGTWLGIHKPIGTVSFYPNKGKRQNGCKWDFTGTCSHLRAFKYFAESIYAPGKCSCDVAISSSAYSFTNVINKYFKILKCLVTFWGYPCESYDDMEKTNCKGVGTRMGGEPGNYRK